MKHCTTAVLCPKCGHRFAVCVHIVPRPEIRKTYVVLCPMNRSRVSVAVADLRPAESCPPGALVVGDGRGATG